MIKKRALKGFTLAEVLITLVILGVVAAITVPSLLKRQTESANRTKIKKAWNVYDTAIQRMVIENNIKTLEGNTDSSLKGWGNKENCPNTTAYFKKAEEESGCKFRTQDGLYWDISKIEEPVVALTKEARDNFNGTVGDDNNVFKFYTSFNENSGAFTTNDVPKVKDATASANLDKFFKFIKPDTSDGNGGSGDICDSGCQQDKFANGDFDVACEGANRKACSFFENLGPWSSKVNVYDDNGNIVSQYINCQNSDISTCLTNDIFGYDENGYINAQYGDCSLMRDRTRCSSNKFFENDETGKQIAEYKMCGTSNSPAGCNVCEGKTSDACDLSIFPDCINEFGTWYCCPSGKGHFEQGCGG